MIPDEVMTPIVDSLNEYADNLKTKDLRGILNSKFKVKGEPVNGVDLSDPATKHAVKAWTARYKAWKEEHGTAEGFGQFENYWSTGSHFVGNAIANATVEEAYGSPVYATIRNWYAGGNTGNYPGS